MLIAEPLKTSIIPAQVCNTHRILRCKNVMSVRSVGDRKNKRKAGPSEGRKRNL